MAVIGFKNALGLHSEALQLRAQRSEILANNLANSDTPGFKARDMDFKEVLDRVTKGLPGNRDHLAVNRTHQGHISVSRDADHDLLYRTPSQPTIDGNSVDTQTEQALFARNSLNYNASFEFLNGKFKGLKNAIRGE